MALPDFSLKSKLLMMLLGVALISTLIVGTQGLYYGKAAITDRVYEHLTSVRETKEQQIKSYFEDLGNHVEALSIDHMTVGAMREFSASFRRLNDAFLDDPQIANLHTYYQTKFLPKLSENVDGEPLLERYLPREAAARYLQYYYMSNNPNALTQKSQLAMADDQSYYSAVHEHYHPIFAALAESFGYYDLFLIDLESGDIVYSVSKETDYATSLKTGPYATSNLGRLYRNIYNSQDRGSIQTVDFEFYRPSYNQPAAFAGITIIDDQHQPVGILAIQISSARINRVMTGNQRWKEQGLGDSGEVFLVGADGTMRSDTRLLMQRDECYRDNITGADGEGAVSQKICRLNTSILLQRVENAAVDLAGEGKTGEMVVHNYADVEVLSAFSALNLAQLDWSIFAEMSTHEINAPIRNFQRELTITIVLISCLVTLVAMRVSNQFTRPLATILAGMKKLRAGDVNTRIDLDRIDEYGDLAKAFTEIIRAIKAQQRLIDQKKRKYSQLLNKVLPETVARRVELGDQYVADRVSNITVLFASLNGFNRYAEQLEPEKAAQVLNELVNACDEAAQRHGVEKVQTVGGNYLAACGLTVPRLDHCQRSIDFARDLLHIVSRVGQAHDVELNYSIAIDAGRAMAGIIGERQFAYDIWGRAVNNVIQISLGAEPGIIVTQAVFDRLDGRADVDTMPPLTARDGGAITLWRVRPVETAVEQQGDPDDG